MYEGLFITKKGEKKGRKDRRKERKQPSERKQAGSKIKIVD